MNSKQEETKQTAGIPAIKSNDSTKKKKIVKTTTDKKEEKAKK